jgi:hypothetical protein
MFDSQIPFSPHPNKIPVKIKYYIFEESPRAL